MGFKIPPPSQATVVETSTDVGDANDTTTDTIMGKIGTDTEMADSSLFDLLGGSTSVQGLPVIVTRATAALPQSTAAAIFTITGGNVRVISLIGEVTTVIETQANETKLTYNPTGTGSSTDICAVLDITADAVGTLYSITGTVATAMKSTSIWMVAPADTIAAPGFIFAPGTIDLDCAASNTGSVQWTIEYVPLESGAAIAAA